MGEPVGGKPGTRGTKAPRTANRATGDRFGTPGRGSGVHLGKGTRYFGELLAMLRAMETMGFPVDSYLDLRSFTSGYGRYFEVDHLTEKRFVAVLDPGLDPDDWPARVVPKNKRVAARFREFVFPYVHNQKTAMMNRLIPHGFESLFSPQQIWDAHAYALSRLGLDRELDRIRPLFPKRGVRFRIPPSDPSRQPAWPRVEAVPRGAPRPPASTESRATTPEQHATATKSSGTSRKAAVAKFTGQTAKAGAKVGANVVGGMVLNEIADRADLRRQQRALAKDCYAPPMRGEPGEGRVFQAYRFLSGQSVKLPVVVVPCLRDRLRRQAARLPGGATITVKYWLYDRKKGGWRSVRVTYLKRRSARTRSGWWYDPGTSVAWPVGEVSGLERWMPYLPDFGRIIDGRYSDAVVEMLFGLHPTLPTGDPTKA